MKTTLDDRGQANYELPLYSGIEFIGYTNVNSLVGRQMSISATGDIRCVLHGEKIPKTFGEGLCWKGFQESASASPCIIRPELCKAHEGVALRGDLQWEKENHLIPHVVYLSYTSCIKVGVTSERNLFSRWIDQGARAGMVLARVPYRQLAGEMEVMLKEYVSDKSNWRTMLQPKDFEVRDLISTKESLLLELPEEYYSLIDEEDKLHSINFPCMERPLSPKSVKLTNGYAYNGLLKGVVGQYLILEDNQVLNVRSHAGFEVDLEFA